MGFLVRASYVALMCWTARGLLCATAPHARVLFVRKAEEMENGFVLRVGELPPCPKFRK